MPDASRPVGDLTDDQIRKRLRVTVQEAARLLGISPEAVRSRLYRGTLDKETGTDGTVYVRLHADQVRPSGEQPFDQSADQSQLSGELVAELRARIEDLRADRDAWREQARRTDYLLGSAMERTRELENRLRELEAPTEPSSPSEPSGAPETVAADTERVEDQSSATNTQTPPQRRPFWRRWMGA